MFLEQHGSTRQVDSFPLVWVAPKRWGSLESGKRSSSSPPPNPGVGAEISLCLSPRPLCQLQGHQHMQHPRTTGSTTGHAAPMGADPH